MMRYMASNIEIKDPNGTKKFLAGNIVFKITTGDIYGMVTSKEEYEKKLAAHEYISILHIAPLTYKLAYLYGCLNYERGKSRDQTFTFWHRTINIRLRPSR